MAGPPHEKPDLKEKKTEINRDLLITEDDPRFSSEEMVACKACSRPNGPNRTSCIYCGKPLETGLRTDHRRVNYKRPETWEDGFSLVFAGKDDISDAVIRSAAELLQMNTDTLKEILGFGIAIPLIYLKSLQDAENLASHLSKAGFGCAVIGDDLLQAKTPPTRTRSIEFEDGHALLEDFNTKQLTQLDYDQKALFVTASLIKSSTEIAGKISKKTLKTAAEIHSVTDEAVIDIYPVSDLYGFRVRSSGFDFSCLGDKMQAFAGANMRELIDRLRTCFKSAVFIDSFSSVAPLVGAAWPTDQIKESSDVSRGPLGGVHKHTVTVLDNTGQFTKFSRLQRHFI